MLKLNPKEEGKHCWVSLVKLVLRWFTFKLLANRNCPHSDHTLISSSVNLHTHNSNLIVVSCAHNVRYSIDYGCTHTRARENRSHNTQCEDEVPKMRHKKAVSLMCSASLLLQNSFEYYVGTFVFTSHVNLCVSRHLHSHRLHQHNFDDVETFPRTQCISANNHLAQKFALLRLLLLHYSQRRRLVVAKCIVL